MTLLLSFNVVEPLAWGHSLQSTDYGLHQAKDLLQF